MTADSTASPQPASLPSTPSDERYKLRLRFRKGYDLRLLSHHDLMRTFERMLRRADLPVRQSQGFHPKPKLIFALSLPLGVLGCEEVAEVELLQEFPLEELQTRIQRQMPPGMEVLELSWVDPKKTAQVRRLTYRLSLESMEDEERRTLRERIEEILRQDECLVTRTKPKHRRVNLRPFLHDLRISQNPRSDSKESESSTAHEAIETLEMELEMTTTGTARPNEVLCLLGLEALLERGVLLERSRLELSDETTSNTESIA